MDSPPDDSARSPHADDAKVEADIIADASRDHLDQRSEGIHSSGTGRFGDVERGQGERHLFRTSARLWGTEEKNERAGHSPV